MIEAEIEEIIDKELASFTFASPADVKCFIDHRIKPKPIRLSLDTEGSEWCECYLVTEHNGKNDSSYRAAFDPKHKEFVREVTLENGIPHYLGRYPSLEDLVDEFA